MFVKEEWGHIKQDFIKLEQGLEDHVNNKLEINLEFLWRDIKNDLLIIYKLALIPTFIKDKAVQLISQGKKSVKLKHSEL